jgi:hypothetical protein
MRQSVGWLLAIGSTAVLIVIAAANPGAAQTVTGQARVAQGTVAGPLGSTTTVLGDTGTLTDAADARQTSQLAGSIPSVLNGGTLHATTIGYPDHVDSEASLNDLTVTVAGTSVGAAFVMSRATSAVGAAGSGLVNIDGLSINGVPIAVTGEPNQVVALAAGRITINEQNSSPAGITVNALHIVVDGVADVVVGSAVAGVR